MASPVSIANKWDLNVLIAQLSAFLLWISGGTSWYMAFPYFLHGRLVIFATLVVNDLQVYKDIFSLRRCMMTLYVLKLCLSFRDAKGSNKITFDDLDAIMMYWLPLRALVENRTV